MVMMTDDLPKFFITPGVGVIVLKCGHITYIVKIHYFPGKDKINKGYSYDVQ